MYEYQIPVVLKECRRARRVWPPMTMARSVFPHTVILLLKPTNIRISSPE